MGAQKEEECNLVLEELCSLTEAENEIGSRRSRGLPNDGKRAGQLIGRVIEGCLHFWSSFDESAKSIALRFLEEASSSPVSNARAYTLTSLISPVTSLERQQTWDEMGN